MPLDPEDMRGKELGLMPERTEPVLLRLSKLVEFRDCWALDMVGEAVLLHEPIKLTELLVTPPEVLIELKGLLEEVIELPEAVKELIELIEPTMLTEEPNVVV